MRVRATLQNPTGYAREKVCLCGGLARAAVEGWIHLADDQHVKVVEVTCSERS